MIAPNNEVLQKFINLLNKYPNNTTIIVNIEEGHFKFWLYEEIGSQQIRYIWGKIDGTASTKDAPDIKLEAFDKRYKKIKKGYQELI